MIKNGDFSEGTSGWNLNPQFGGEAGLSVKRGELYVHITKGGEYTYSINLDQFGLKIEQGKSYTVSFKARCRSVNRDIYVKIGLAREPWTAYSDYENYVLTTEKKNYTFKFSMIKPTDTNAYIEFQLGTNDINNWYGKTATGEYTKPYWEGYPQSQHLMNSYKHNFAYPRHVANYVKIHYLDNKQYDGVMFDILLELAPTWASKDNPPTFDTDEDGDFDQDDHKKYQEGVLYLLKYLRGKCPDAIITGNGGTPWTKDCSYYTYANGNMHENALGNQFGSLYWNANNGEWYPKEQRWLKGVYGTWDGYRTCINAANPNKLARYHFISVDVRFNRTQEKAKNLQQLTAEDLRLMRLGLCTSLLEDGGYFGFDRGDCLHGQLWWFDEYDADLGNPVESYKTGMYGKGNNKKEVYSRKFENGVVIVNHNPTATVVYFKIEHQDVTTKKAGKTFTIPKYDGRIYIKE